MQTGTCRALHKQNIMEDGNRKEVEIKKKKATFWSIQISILFIQTTSSPTKAWWPANTKFSFNKSSFSKKMSHSSYRCNNFCWNCIPELRLTKANKLDYTTLRICGPVCRIKGLIILTFSQQRENTYIIVNIWFQLH